MAVPSSGPISLAKIRDEIENNNYNANLYGYTSGQTSLIDLSDGTYDAINTANASADRPNGSIPHSMSEFYSYDHDLSSLTLLQTISGQQHSTATTAATAVSINVNAFKGKDVRAVFHYVSGSNYTGDFQLDNIMMPYYGSMFIGMNPTWTSMNTGFGGSTFGAGQLNPDFTSNGNWETNTNNSSSYTTTTFGSIGTSTGAYGRWVGRSNGTPSGGTGLTSSPFSGMHVYAETSSNGSGYPSKNFWLRSPEWTHISTESGNALFSFTYGAYGSTIGTMRVYFLEV
jgi:hypothetical protein